MRDILFRAKRIENWEWIEGNLILSDDAEEGWEAIIIPTTDSNMYTKGGARGTVSFENWHRVNKDTICRYTGLTDIDGNKIWENDIFAYGEEMGVIRFGENGDYKYDYGFYVDFGDSFLRNDLGFWLKERTIKIIGNIFDNQELL